MQQLLQQSFIVLRRSVLVFRCRFVLQKQELPLGLGANSLASI
jgi:hypothetical protein